MGRPAKDLTGRVFGLLTALRYVGRSKWRCRCTCGREIEVRMSRLIGTDKITKSCGCATMKNLAGQVFGELTALRTVGQTKSGNYLWSCLCSCGKQVEVISSSLVQHHTKSCGHIAWRDLAGLRFGRLTAMTAVSKRKGGHIAWRCICTCGKGTIVSSSALLNGTTKSCGCLAREIVAVRGRAYVGEKSPTYKHGYTSGGIKAREYAIWDAMIYRCTNPTCTNYFRYGGSNPPVKVCDRWLGAPMGFLNFISDMGRRPSAKHSLSRYLDSGNYEPGNVEWGTVADQRAEAKGKRAMLALRKWREQQKRAA
jgi:hypothetical protein